jgi:SAM-dependent methyltransferase
MPAHDESPSTRTAAVREFYEALAPNYDAMTGFANRFERERPAFRALVERYDVKRALDAGCGSGFHSIVLAQLGVDVTALDLSQEMIRRTEEHARLHRVGIRTFVGGFHEIPADWRETFDGVFVMGNSLPHLLSQQELEESLARLMSVLRRSGTLVIQCLNYARILNRKDHILNAKEVDGFLITREYEYDSEGILFSIVSREVGTPGAVEIRETVRLRPVLQEELAGVLSRLGAKTESFGNIQLDPYQPLTSTDLVIVASRK